MGDMGEIFNAMREMDRERRESNLASAVENMEDGWDYHTAWHWSRDLNGSRLDYWPSRNKFRWKGKTHCGDVMGFIRNREGTDGHERPDA